jgi:trehalose 6-phosphate phosphatase
VLDVDATIAALTRRPAQTALLVDFDGSLSPIVERPEDARPLPEAIAQLARLAARLGRVGIVSGRPVEFLATHVPIAGVTYAGLYGIERLTGGLRSIDPRVVPYLDAVAAATSDARDRLPGELVEPKAGVSVTLHWRPSPERAQAVTAVAEELASRHGLAQLRTRMAVELRPPIGVDKGDATRALVEGFDVGAFAGDDTGDLPAFAALAAAVDDGVLRRAVRIGVHSPEAPPELVTSVDVLVDGPAGLAALFARVADEIA